MLIEKGLEGRLLILGEKKCKDNDKDRNYLMRFVKYLADKSIKCQ
jgi:hypothetical protein